MQDKRKGDESGMNKNNQEVHGTDDDGGTVREGCDHLNHDRVNFGNEKIPVFSGP